jgi:hypothetical protein
MLLLDPGRYFAGAIAGADAFGNSGAQRRPVDPRSNRRPAGAGRQTRRRRHARRPDRKRHPGQQFRHALPAWPIWSRPTSARRLRRPARQPAAALTVAGRSMRIRSHPPLPQATAGESWSAPIEAIDPDGTRFYWQLVKRSGRRHPDAAHEIVTDDDGYHAIATLNWTPTATADVNSEIVVRVQDSRGGVAHPSLPGAVVGGNHAPVIDALGRDHARRRRNAVLPLTAADADGDRLTLAFATCRPAPSSMPPPGC